MNDSLSENFLQLRDILIENSLFFTQDDMGVLSETSSKLSHPWIEQALGMSETELFKFDGLREFKALRVSDWEVTIESLEVIYRDCVRKFEQVYTGNELKINSGGPKKRHELTQIYTHYQSRLKNKRIVDIGGGKGHLSLFLSQNLNCECTIIDKDRNLLTAGEKLFNKHEVFNQKFIECEIGKEATDQDNLYFGDQHFIALHACGSLSNDIIRQYIESHQGGLTLFSCCYSKLRQGDVNLSKLARIGGKTLHLNQRSLGAATLSSAITSKEFYDFRLKIMDYKYSFYYLLASKFNIQHFYPMSNARRSLYEKNFPQFYYEQCQKFSHKIPQEVAVNELSFEELESFFQEEQSRNMCKYFQVYYAFYRYFGKYLELYLLLDRVIYLREHGIMATLDEVFDPQLSPRNKAISCH